MSDLLHASHGSCQVEIVRSTAHKDRCHRERNRHHVERLMLMYVGIRKMCH